MAKKIKKPVFDIPIDATPEAEKLARGFKLEANQVFLQETEQAEDLVRRFWFRNNDNDGEGSLVRVAKNDENGDPIPGEWVTEHPTGPEIMAAFGTDAEAVWAMATHRATMLATLSATLGKPDIVDLASMVGPYELTFNPDGSFLQATPR